MLEGLRALRLPFLIWVIVAGTLLACLIDFSFLGFSLKGYVWFFTFMLALMVVLRESPRIALPIWIWVPWVTVLLVYLLVSPFPNAVQRTAMMICPILVGAAVSTFPADNRAVQDFLTLCRTSALVLLVGSALLAGVLSLGGLPAITGLAAQSMTGALFANVFAVEYVEKRTGALRYWFGMAFLPIMALTRTAIVAAALTLPLTAARLGLRRRAVLLIVLAAIGLSVFYSPRVQKKMFYSGHGTLSDMSLDNPDFKTTGRLNMWHYLKKGISEEPWFGHGANAQEWALYRLFGSTTQPHNDWIRLEYDYGYIGTFIFALCVLLQAGHALVLGRKSTGVGAILLLAGAAAFVPFALIMLTDNIILYAAYYGNLHFAMLGLAYAARRDAQRSVSTRRRWKVADLSLPKVTPGASS